MPLADRIRPRNIDDIAGQRHLLAPGCALRNIILGGQIPSMIFYGPPGIGKTTVANVIAANTGMSMHKLNGTSAGIADIRSVIADAGGFGGFGNGILLYLDEIQYLNKKQQQILLEYIENGIITLIAATTENPYFYVYGAVLSRCTVFEFKPLTASDVTKVIHRAFDCVNEERALADADLPPLTFDDKDAVTEIIAYGCGGDVRKAVNAVELCALAGENGYITVETAKAVTQRSSNKYDRDGDQHYDLMSAFQKSIRGSDENAALHYLARLIIADDMPSICRRLLVIAAEDIGLAYPSAIPIVKACVDSALQLGFPEARIPLADAVILLCTAPKSNSGVCAIDSALADVSAGKTGDVPEHLKDSHYDGAKKLHAATQTYIYPHDCPNHYVKQQYLPEAVEERVYYKFGDNKNEQAALAYRKKITGQENGDHKNNGG
jgi:putative ATPase